MQLNRPFATVTPTLDGDVLAVVATASTETFTISQIQRILTTASGEGIRKVLTRLTAQGVVLHNQVGRTHTYRLNTEHLAAVSILALSRLASTLMQRIETHLKEWRERPVYAAVFGSATTGTMTLRSDIDLFLVRGSRSEPHVPPDDSDVWERQVAELVRAVTGWTGNDARVVEYTEDDVRRAAGAGEPLLRDVAKQGLTVAGSRAWLNKRLRQYGSTEPGRS